MARKITGILCLLASAVTAFLAFKSAGGWSQGFDVQQLLRGSAGPWSMGTGAGVLVGLPMLLGGGRRADTGPDSDQDAPGS
jgi:hypothetical protein